MPLLDIQNLQVIFQGETRKEILKGLSLQVDEMQIVSLVGGSGSGKTMTGLSILGLLPLGMMITQGKIIYRGQNLLEYSQNQMRSLRGKEISMIFQEPLSAFNPVFTIGTQIEESLIYHTDLRKDERKKKIHEFLDLAGIPDPKRVARSYPHQLSGGMRQRAMIAQAIAGQPKLIIADEPTSNLDVTLQAMIMELFRKLKVQLKLSMLLITHDLGVVTHLADKAVVVFDGRAVEEGRPKDILETARHPFTNELIKTIS